MNKINYKYSNTGLCSSNRNGIIPMSQCEDFAY